jgi:hypothetical protein
MVAHLTSEEPIHPYVSYHFSETIRTESDHREISTQIFLTADDYVGYRYREEVFGSTAPLVQSVEFSNGYHRKATAEEQRALIQALLTANVFELTNDLKPSNVDYFADLHVRINTREVREYYFYSPPRSPMRKSIHETMLQFAKKMQIDQPPDRANSTTVTEGDKQPARAVKLSEVLDHPDEYHGKRISVIGFYHEEFEGSSFSIDQTASRKLNTKQSVWRSSISTFADKSAINDRNDAWLRIDGIFLRGPGGHMGMWPGEIVRLTRIEPVSKLK